MIGATPLAVGGDLTLETSSILVKIFYWRRCPSVTGTSARRLFVKGKGMSRLDFCHLFSTRLFRKSVPLTIKDLVVDSDVYSGIIHAYSDIFSNHGITYW